MGAGIQIVQGGIRVVRQGGKDEKLWCVVSLHMGRASSGESSRDGSVLANALGINLGGGESESTLQHCRSFEMPGVKDNETQEISIVNDASSISNFLQNQLPGYYDTSCPETPCTFNPDNFTDFTEDPSWELRDSSDFYFIQNSSAGGGELRYKIHLDAWIVPGTGWTPVPCPLDGTQSAPTYHDSATVVAPLESYDKFLTFTPCKKTEEEDPRFKHMEDWFAANCFAVSDTFCAARCQSADCGDDVACKLASEGNNKSTIIFNMVWFEKKGLFKQPAEGDLKIGNWCATAHKSYHSAQGKSHILTENVNWFAGITSGLSCISPSCTTGEPFRKYLNDLMTAELTAGGFPYIVPGSLLPSQSILLGGTEIFNGYTLQGRHVERDKLLEETITRLGFSRRYKIKPKIDAASKIDGVRQGIGFAVDDKRRETYIKDADGKLVPAEPYLEKKDVWTLSVFSSYTKSQAWEMVNIWKQTIEASIFCPSGGGRCCEQEQDQDTGKWKNKTGFTLPADCKRAYKQIVGPAGAPVFFTAHELELEKTFLAKYNAMAASAGITVENQYIAFSAAISTAHSDSSNSAQYAGQKMNDDDTAGTSEWGTFHMNAQIKIKKLLQIINDGEWGTTKIQDSLTIDLPKYTFGPDVKGDEKQFDSDGNEITGDDKSVPSFDLKEMKLTYNVQIENNLSLSISGIKPLDMWEDCPDPDDPSKTIKCLRPLSLQVQYTIDDARMLTIDLDTLGNFGLGLSIEWERADFQNEWVGKMMDNTMMQMGLTWNPDKGDGSGFKFDENGEPTNEKQEAMGGFEASWFMNKSFNETMSAQWDILEGTINPVATLLSKQYGEKEHGLGKVNVGVTASWRPFDMYGSIKNDINNFLNGVAGSEWVEQELAYTDNTDNTLSGWQKYIPNLNATLSTEKEFYKTASVFGDIVMRSSWGAKFGSTSGTLSGWTMRSQGVVVVELKNRMLEFIGLPLNVHPHLANGFQFILGNRKSEYFGSKWGGFEFGFDFGLFGWRASFASRHSAILGISERRRYGTGANWGIFPWGTKENDGDYVARVYPCVMNRIAEWCEDDWFDDFIKTGGSASATNILTSDCNYLKDKYYPLNKMFWDKKGVHGMNSRKNINYFYAESIPRALGESKIEMRSVKVQKVINGKLKTVKVMKQVYVPVAGASEVVKCNRDMFDKWAAVTETRKFFPDFPYRKPANLEWPEGEGIAEYDFQDYAVKAYCYYRREIVISRNGESCTDERPPGALGSLEKGIRARHAKFIENQEKSASFPYSKTLYNFIDWFRLSDVNAFRNKGKDSCLAMTWAPAGSVTDGRVLPQFCKMNKGKVISPPCFHRGKLKWAGYYSYEKGKPISVREFMVSMTLRQKHIDEYIRQNRVKEIRSCFKSKAATTTDLMEEHIDALNIENSWTDSFAQLYWLTAKDKLRANGIVHRKEDPDGDKGGEAQGRSQPPVYHDYWSRSGRKKYFKKIGIGLEKDTTFTPDPSKKHRIEDEDVPEDKGDESYHLRDTEGLFPCAMNNDKGKIDSILDTPLGFAVDIGKSAVEMLTFGKFFSKKKKAYSGAVDAYYSDAAFGLMKATWNRRAKYGSINLWEDYGTPVDAIRGLGNFLGVTHDNKHISIVMLGTDETKNNWESYQLYPSGKGASQGAGGNDPLNYHGNFVDIWNRWWNNGDPDPNKTPMIDMGVVDQGIFTDSYSDVEGNFKVKVKGNVWNRNKPMAGCIIKVGKYYLLMADHRYFWLPYDPNTELSKLNREFREEVRVITHHKNLNAAFKETQNHLLLTVDPKYRRGGLTLEWRSSHPFSADMADTSINTRRGWEYKENKSIDPFGGAASLVGRTVLVYPAESDPGVQCNKWYNKYFYANTTAGWYPSLGFYMLDNAIPEDYEHTGAHGHKKGKKVEGKLIKDTHEQCGLFLEGRKKLWIDYYGRLLDRRASTGHGSTPWSDFKTITGICCCMVSILPNPKQNKGFLNTIQNRIKWPFTNFRIFPETDSTGLGRLYFWQWEFEQRKQMAPGMCAIPWKGNSNSCHLSFYRFMHDIWMNYFELFVDGWGGDDRDGADIDQYCRAKINVVRYCGYNFSNAAEIILYDSKLARVDCSSGLEEASMPFPSYVSFETDGIGIPCRGVPDGNKLQTTISVEFFSHQSVNVDAPRRGWSSLVDLGCRWDGGGGGGKIRRLDSSYTGEVIDIRDILNAKDELTFIQLGCCDSIDVVFKDLYSKYKYIFSRAETIKSGLDAALLACRPEMLFKFTDQKGTYVKKQDDFIGLYCEGDAVTNLEEMTTMKKKISFHGGGGQAFITESEAGTTFSSKIANDQNIIYLGSKALVHVSDPFDGFHYSDRVIKHAGLQRPMGKEQMFGTTHKMSDEMNKAWLRMKDGYNGVGWTFDYHHDEVSSLTDMEHAVPTGMEEGNIVDNPAGPKHEMSGNTLPPNRAEWGKAKNPAHLPHLNRAWSNYVTTFEHFYPIMIDQSRAVMREKMAATQIHFYGLLENDLRAFHLINMKLFEPWVLEAIEIGAKIKEKDIGLCDGIEALYDFLYPIFIRNYPGKKAELGEQDPLAVFGLGAPYGAKEMEMTYLWKLLNPTKPAFVQSYYKGIHNRNKIIDKARKEGRTHEVWDVVPGEGVSYNSVAQAGPARPASSKKSVLDPGAGNVREIVYKQAFNFHVLEDVLYYIYNMTGLVRGITLPGQGSPDGKYSTERYLDLGNFLSVLAPKLPVMGSLTGGVNKINIDIWKSNANACTERAGGRGWMEREDDKVDELIPWAFPYSIVNARNTLGVLTTEGIRQRVFYRTKTPSSGVAGRKDWNQHMFTGFWNVLNPEGETFN